MTFKNRTLPYLLMLFSFLVVIMGVPMGILASSYELIIMSITASLFLYFMGVTAND